MICIYHFMKYSKEEKVNDVDIYTHFREGRVYDNMGVSTTVHESKPFTRSQLLVMQ